MLSNEKKLDEMDNQLTPYENIANAIILQACKDYRRAYRLHVRTYRLGDKPNEKLGELERFFRSDWYRTLTTVDGEYLMKRIRDEVILQQKSNKN